MITVTNKDGKKMGLREFIRLGAAQAAKETRIERYGKKGRGRT